MAATGSLTRRAALARRSFADLRPSWRGLRGVVRSFLVSFLALAVTLGLVPGQQVPDRGTTTVATVVLAVLLVGALLRPLLTRLTVITGGVGLLLTGFLAQSLVLGVALAVVPSIEPIDFPEIVLVAWLVAIVAAVLNWVVDTSGEEVFLDQVLGRAVRTARGSDVTGPGLLVVQLDGVAAPLVRQAAAAGAMPHLTRLLRSGDHRLRTWHTAVPSTTPAGQAMLLHGDPTAIPAFRWYDKERGRVLECSKPADAGEAEADLTTGRGLLADGGASVANLFSGDAPFHALTMSHAKIPGGRGAADFAASRSGFARSIVLFVGQVLAEWYQGRRQRFRDVVPRVHRGGSFVLLRGLTTVVLKDLSVAIVADQMARGVPVVYVDFLDYDEVAHHAGPTRPESMRTLEGLDRVLRFFHDLAQEVGRDYEIVILSDHGQTQGSTFLQLDGRTLADAVAEIVAADEIEVASEQAPAEVLGPAHMLHASGARTHGVMRPAVQRRMATGAPSAADRRAGRAAGRVEVAASGSVAHLYLTAQPGRVAREDVEELLPTLLPGIRALAHVGFVLTRRRDGAVVVEHDGGSRVLTPEGTRDGHGSDPLAVYGPGAAADLLHLDACRHVGDVVAFGRYDPALNEVAAFEELVGSHGGIGGWQTEAMLVHPADWDVPQHRLGGMDVHRLLLGRLVHHGLRRTDLDVAAGSPSVPSVSSEPA